VLELGPQSSIADYLVLANGMSRPQVKALYNELHSRLKAAGERHSRAEGTDVGWWILMDYGDVIVHLMQPEARDHYDLDGLYGDAREIDWRKLPLPPLPVPKARLRPTRDAADELEKLLALHPDEARGHLTLGNLYADQLRDIPRARQQYNKVLQLDPSNPQAPAIRYWLVANPG